MASYQQKYNQTDISAKSRDIPVRLRVFQTMGWDGREVTNIISGHKYLTGRTMWTFVPNSEIRRQGCSLATVFTRTGWTSWLGRIKS